jgi:hypothetical protein
MGLWARVRAQLFGDDRPDVDAPTGQPTNEPTPPEIEAPTDPPTHEPAQPEIEPPAECAETVEPAEPGVSAAEGDPGAVAARQERAAGRMVEDERLRGDLTDDEFQPLLDWALAVTDRVASSTSGLPDEEADARIDATIEALREVLSAAGAAIVAHNEGDADRRASELRFLAHEGIESVLGLVPGVASGDTPARLSAFSEMVAEQADLGGAAVAAGLANAMAIDERDAGASQ